MFIVTVQFKVQPEHVTSFRDAMILQAQNSLQLEPGCKVFDVCTDPNDDSIIFLYEKYDSSDAFDDHLRSEHFTSFDALVAPWVTGKTVKTLMELSS